MKASLVSSVVYDVRDELMRDTQFFNDATGKNVNVSFDVRRYSENGYSIVISVDYTDTCFELYISDYTSYQTLGENYSEARKFLCDACRGSL